MMIRKMTAGSLLLIGLVLCAGSQPAWTDERSAAFEFALLADNPYRPENVSKFESLIRDVNQEEGIEWVLHLGDVIDTSAGGCPDEVLRARFELFQKFQCPFVFTPGDNDWFDCGRESPGVDEYERLDFLRTLFFPRPGFTTGGRVMEVESQSRMTGFEDYVENSLWIKSDVVFCTVHLVAMTRPATDSVLASRRMDAALAWIKKSFELAKERKSPAIFIAMQADPWIVSGNRHLIKGICPDCLRPRAGLERLYPVLEEETVAFGRPVVLAVGDSHAFRIDKPLYSSDQGLLIENFTRVEPFGDPDVHWVRVRVEPAKQEVFTFQQEIVGTNGSRSAAH